MNRLASRKLPISRGCSHPCPLAILHQYDRQNRSRQCQDPDQDESILNAHCCNPRGEGESNHHGEAVADEDDCYEGVSEDLRTPLVSIA